MNRRRTILLIVAVAIAAIAVYSCYLTPKAQVERSLKRAIYDIEDQNAEKVIAYFADDFVDSFGFTKDQWAVVIAASMAQWTDIEIRLVQLQIEVDGDKATAKFHVVGEATRVASLGSGLPDRQGYRWGNIGLQLVKRDGKWLLAGWSNVSAKAWGVGMPEL